MLRRTFVLFVLFTSLLAGCDCSGDPPDRACTTSSECRNGQTCIDDRCVTIDASSGVDAFVAIDAASGIDASPRDASADAACISLDCEATEGCYDGFDDDCDDRVDEGCACAVGTTTRCLPGRSAPTASLCSFGEMTCEGAGEFGEWGPCVGGGGLDGGSSLYGCRRIGIMGAPGANPSSNFQAWLEMQGAIATRFHATADAATLSRAELETFDLVIVDWLQRLYSTEEATTLADWVRAGGALMVMTGHDSGNTADRHLSLLAALGPSFDRDAGPLDGPATLLPHPSTVTADGTGTLPPVSFYGGLRTTVPAELADEIVPMAVIGDATVGVAGPLGDGRVLLFGDEWIEFDSEWSTMPPIPQLWLDTVRWLSPDSPVLPVCE
ncbi:DUF4350 domain-containing protein [Sandaracinus amylolyticus]|uniref:DUF4350 domain-containing protein n=1 Tax=Sandaracinus amylolyticus TaxID=927083 RepID=UPI001F191294|nr:DUF4350 domain-containing protein [Sandaracinus amylolyticus]UJR86036.1 Hypothetical protein I5071_81170 [Sandaracinus amylolyticus]